MPGAGVPGRYEPLLDWLRAPPAEESTVEITLEEIESLIGGPLPMSGWTPILWTASDTARRNWQRVGWQARLERTGDVVFTRTQESEPDATR